MRKKICKTIVALALFVVMTLVAVTTFAVEKYSVEPGTVWQIEFAEATQDGRHLYYSFDKLPEFFPENHAMRIYKGMMLEAPVKVYLAFDIDSRVYWVVDYYRLGDLEMAFPYAYNEEEQKYEPDVWSTYPDLFTVKSKDASYSRVVTPVMNGENPVYYYADADMIKLYTDNGKKETYKSLYIYRSTSDSLQLFDLYTENCYTLKKTNIR